MKTLQIFLTTLLLALLAFLPASAQKTAMLAGTVRDAQTGEALPGANILLVGTGMGATSDVAGNYVVRNVPPGSYTVRVTYVGYKTTGGPLTLREGADLRKDFKLAAVGVEGEEVVVTAQAAGQNEAINRQLTSMPVMNVVSAARIQELPDANAAESVGRLPGVSLVRTGGEGSQVVIRGLSPQYNQITIDGVELPSDVASSNNLTSGDRTAQEAQASMLGDRAEDLSMISSSMLGGIEVIKAITPDMDAAVLGGVVNFDMRKAARTGAGGEGLLSEGNPWVPRLDLRAQYGYNNLKNTRNDYRYVGSLEKRFAEDKFGVFLQASAEQRNLSDNELGVGYALNDKSHGDAGVPDLNSLQLTDVQRSRKRVGGTVVLDYQHQDGEIGLMNFVSSSDTRSLGRGELIYPISNDLYYTASDTRNKLNVLSNLLSVKQEIPFFHIDLKLSHSYSESHNPEDLAFQNHQIGAGYVNMPNITKQPPNMIASLRQPDATRATLEAMSTAETFSRERALTGTLDLQSDLSLTEDLSAKIKFGGMWQHRTRNYDYTINSGSAWHEDLMINTWLRVFPWLKQYNGGDLSFLNFVYDGYSYGTFLNGDYSLAYPINIDMMWLLLPVAKGITMTGFRGGYQPNVLGSTINDYDGKEDKSAAYAMVTFNIGDRISVLPGVRYQNLSTTYTAARGVIVPGNKLQGGDTTLTQAHGYWLPMVHLRYRPLEWLQLHFAYTNTLNYPDYSAITPRFLVGQGYITYNNWRLKPATSENLDLVAAVHSNEIGLLTIDGFKKRIKDLIFFSKTYISDLSAYPDLPQGGKALYEFNTYINNPNPIDVYGLETEWQTHFWYLPKPLDGIVLSLNYTHIFSEAKYPKSTLYTFYDEEGNATQTVVDTFYTSRLLNQPNDIVNLVVGYDYEGFSARVSLLYQDNIFKKPDFWMQQRVNSAKYMRWDLSVKQDLPWFGLQLFLNINNITGENELDVNQKTGFAANEQRYGMSADLGFRVKL